LKHDIAKETPVNGVHDSGFSITVVAKNEKHPILWHKINIRILVSSEIF
jgi:hypothetical protein